MNENEKRGRNWRAKYLTKNEFWSWVNNHFFHMKIEVRVNSIVNGLALAILIALLVWMVTRG